MKKSTLDTARTDWAYFLREKIQNLVSKIANKFNWRKYSPDQFEIVQVQIEVPNLPATFRNYRIVHISDLHYGQWLSSERLEGVVELINENNPDLIAITGDFVSYVVDESIEVMAQKLAKLRPKDRTVAVLGNHDHWAGSEKVRQILKKGNVLNLSNNFYVVTRTNSNLYIAGVDSVTVKKDQLDLLLRMLPLDGPALLLVHEPDYAVKTAKTKRFSLQLSGHSHGGQFIIPGLGPLFRGQYFSRYPAGKYNVEEMIQYTNRGIGTNSYWLRVNCLPEITVITLV